jgi:hypothetical protein
MLVTPNSNKPAAFSTGILKQAFKKHNDIKWTVTKCMGIHDSHSRTPETRRYNDHGNVITPSTTELYT